MRSSTSPSDSGWPRLTLTLLAVGILAWLSAAAYSTQVHAEVRFYRRALELKQRWITQLRKQPGPKLLLAGGSSCAFALDPTRLAARTGLPTVNLGLHAGLGARVLTQLALAEAQSGDTLVLALEPTLLCSDWEPTALGRQFAAALHRPEWLAEPGASQPPWSERAADWVALRPGARHCAVALARLVTGKQQGRYRLEDLHPDGWQQNDLRWDIRPFTTAPWKLRPEGRRWLEFVRAECSRRGVRLIATLPWAYAEPTEVDSLRQKNAALWREIEALLPVVTDPEMGVWSERARFLDTEWHLDAEGAAHRSERLAEGLERAGIRSPRG